LVILKFLLINSELKLNDILSNDEYYEL